jgi:hypothetical protein
MRMTIAKNISRRRVETIFGTSQFFGDGFGRAGGAPRLAPLQFFERAIVRALSGIDPALQAVEGVDAALEDMTERVVFIDTVGLVLGGVGMKSPELGFDAAQTAELPIGVDERIDQETFEGSGGLELLVIIGGEGFEGGGIFAGDDLGFGVDSGLESVEAGDGLPLR